MKDSQGKKKLERTGKRNTGSSPDGPVGSYTPQQRERIRNGLRIWARVAIRSYLRQRAGDSHTEAGPVEGEES